ncbi:MAG: hypothetical protein HQL37_07250 [Alphaproteobacteria bacterium]|nr:hypothetical protein [Alphaproteobacteria bacterium]
MAIGTIIVSREKTEIAPAKRLPNNIRFSLKNNRVAIKLVNPPITEKLVVRGHTLTNTTRVASAMLAAFLRDKIIFRRPDSPDLGAIWERLQSAYDRVYVPNSWIAVYVNGKPLLTTSERERPIPDIQARIDLINRIELLAGGGDVSDALLRLVLKDILDENKELVLHHESQTAIVLTETLNSVKFASLERTAGMKRSVSLSVATNKTPVTIPVMLAAAADLLEVIDLSEFLSPVRIAAASKASPGAPPIPIAQYEAATMRRRQLTEVINGFEKAYHIHYRPERPACLDPVAFLASISSTK